MKNKLTTCTLSVDGRDISYEWIRKKVKNINLRVRADGTVFVSSPHAVSQKEIEMFLIQKANFLFRALDAAEERRNVSSSSFSFAEGEKIYLFGEAKILRFSAEMGKKIEEKDGFLYLSEEETPEKTQKKLRIYAENRLREVIFSMCKTVFSRMDHMKKFPEIRFRLMRATWGNCRARAGILTFNTRLVCYPLSCIEYIVMHEFVHFSVPNHSADFYTILSHYMPDWKERRALLNKSIINVFFESHSEKSQDFSPRTRVL